MRLYPPSVTALAHGYLVGRACGRGAGAGPLLVDGQGAGLLGKGGPPRGAAGRPAPARAQQPGRYAQQAYAYYHSPQHRGHEKGCTQGYSAPDSAHYMSHLQESKRVKGRSLVGGTGGAGG